MVRALVTVLGLILLAGCSGTLESKGPVISGHPEYDRQVALVKDLSKEADFTALRLAYTDTPYYSPYAVKDIKPVLNALKKKDFAECGRLALRHLEREFVSLSANYAAMVCYKELGKEDISGYYRFIVDGLIDSIADSGDGRSIDTAFTTISNDELYTFIRMGGLAVEGQSLVHKDGRVFDLMEVVDPETDKKVSLYFDITIQMTKGMRSLEK